MHTITDSLFGKSNVMGNITISDTIFQIDEQNLDNIPKNDEQPYLNIHDCSSPENFHIY